MAKKIIPLQLHCDNCSRDGFVNNTGNNFLVICNNCETETAQVWCPICKIGGQFVANIEKHPTSWKCPNCRKKHLLTQEFYDSYEFLYFEENIPTDLKRSISSLNLRSPIDLVKQYALLFLATLVFLYLVQFLSQPDKTITAFLFNADFILILWTAFLSMTAIPLYISLVGKEITSKKGRRSRSISYYLWVLLLVAGVPIFIFPALRLPGGVHMYTFLPQFLLVASVMLLFSLANGIYAFTSIISPAWFRGGVLFYEYKHTRSIASLQILHSILCLFWIYIRLF